MTSKVKILLLFLLAPVCLANYEHPRVFLNTPCRKANGVLCQFYHGNHGPWHDETHHHRRQETIPR